ncbi:MAG: carboxymuconolactone decarboxylase family protein [Alphaproteobacteria bacterium]
MAHEIPRLEIDRLQPGLAGVLRPRVERLGYLGEFFKCMGHQPEALTAFMDFTERSKGGLADTLVELVALTVAGVTGNDYERHQHERLSLKLGLTRDWVAAVNVLSPDDQPLLGGDAQAVQRLVLAAVERQGHDVSDLLGDVTERLGPESAVAVLFLIGRYVTHSMIVNALALEPPVPSIFDREGP